MIATSLLLKAYGGRLDHQFRQAIASTAADLSIDCYLAAHLAVSSLWGIFFAAVFLLQSNISSTQGLIDLVMIIFLVAMLVGSAAAFYSRAPEMWRSCKASILANIQQSAALSHLLTKPMLVRSAKLEDKTTSAMEEKVTGSLLAGFNIWLHRYKHEWLLRGIMFAFIYSLWALGPILIDPRKNDLSADLHTSSSQSYLLTVSNPHYLSASMSRKCCVQNQPLALSHPLRVHIPSQVLMVLANIGEALISFDKHVTSMFTSQAA